MKYPVVSCLFAFIFAVSGFFYCTTFASAATVNYYVDPTGTDDGGHGTGTGTGAWATIQYAVTNVLNPATDTVIINIAAGTYTTNNDDILVNRSFTDLTFQGAGADTTIVQSHASPASSTAIVFSISSSNNVAFEDLTIRYGRSTTTGAGIKGGNGDLTIRNSIIFDNDGVTTSDSGGVYSSGDLVIENSTFFNNDGNYVGALYTSGGAIQITNSTFFGNVGSSAAAIYITSATSLTITNSMFAQGSELLLQGSYSAYIKNSILANKSAGSYDLEYYNYFGTVYAENTIIGTEDTDGAAPYIIDGVDGNSEVESGTLASLNIKAEVSENGSVNKTLTLALQDGSPAIDAGDATANNGVSIPTTDQRGSARVSTVDIGPFEYQGSDTADPLILSSSIEATNIYVDITFDEGVYNTNGGSGGLQASDLAVALTQGVGDVTNVSISSLTRTDYGALTGGETTVRATISLTGTARGVETISFSPTDNASIYDAAGNPMSTSQTTSELTLDGAFQYYVDPTGTDDGSHGTASGTDAWATIQYAITNVSDPTTSPIVINISGSTFTTSNDNIEITRGFTNLTLKGAGATSTIVQSHADPLSSTAEVFYITSSAVTFEDMTIRYGRSSTSGPAIKGSSGDLTLRRVAVVDNDTTGGSGYSGGVSGSGNTTIEDSTFTGNDGSYVSTLYLSGSTKTVTVTNSTFFGNGGSQTAGAIYLNGPSFIVTNSTFAQNGNILMQGSGDVYLKNSLLVDSTDYYDLEYYNYFGTVYPYSTVIGREDTDGAAPYITNGVNGNVVDDGTLASMNISAALADNSTVNGTQTLSLLVGSLAIDTGNSSANNGVSIPALDQRGAARAGVSDIGAFEYAGVFGSPYADIYFPADDATAVSLDSNLVLTFSEIVDVETGNVYIYKADDTLIETIDVTGLQVTGTGTDTIVIDPTSNFTELTSYYIQIDATAFDDVSSNSYAGIADETTWTFTGTD
ncbi:Ig-like domain-containing protein, partial [Candidatus Uhrbacteria bacterium]|nr:Ig-like domain-containing protein [Candidatus Uhrbacteria bacterium]